MPESRAFDDLDQGQRESLAQAAVDSARSPVGIVVAFVFGGLLVILMGATAPELPGRWREWTLRVGGLLATAAALIAVFVLEIPIALLLSQPRIPIMATIAAVAAVLFITNRVATNAPWRQGFIVGTVLWLTAGYAAGTFPQSEKLAIAGGLAVAAAVGWIAGGVVRARAQNENRRVGPTGRQR